MWAYGAGVGLAAGGLLAAWLESLISHERTALAMPPASDSNRRWRSIMVVVITALLCGGLTWSEMSGRWLETPEVQPSETGRLLRLVYHLILVSLLLTATVVDLDCYMIPDAITQPGTVIGVVGAVLIGELQIAHLWVDWGLDPLSLSLHGPYIPAWYDGNRWLHALSWSLAGLVMGAGLTQLVRVVSSRLLGQEAMGFGDVTLMAMMGSFLGWQAMIVTFLLAPLFGLLLSVPGALLFRKPYLPYGPYLSLAGVTVLFGWGWIWQRTRVIFSDAAGLLILAGIAAVALVGLLGLIRLYRAIPGRQAAPTQRDRMQ